ncbi:NERD domain-containing protein [Arthrobacter rhombi]|uniref:NERD domain-containing protein n=1 Tax=Arthrobacter rhombi TaxID=71253 RepID=UPI003FD53BEA
MMPGFCPEDAPPGEKSLYTAMNSSSETTDWIVLHSLGIADHVTQVEGEADFVVIVPGVGILVIEVKSHQTIHRRADGQWKLGRDAPTARGPFEQARGAMHSLRSFLEKKIDLRSTPVLYAVWFTSVRARSMLPANPEWHDWQVLDSESLKAAPAAITRTLQAGTKHLNNKIKYFSYGGVGPDHQAAEQIASVLRPRFELATVAGDRRRTRGAQLITFIEEQYRALDAASDNRAVLFSGPAGAGKTLLATEAARRETAMGRRGRLLCFNRFLGKRLSGEMADVNGLRVGTFHQELLRLAGISRAPDEAEASFWQEELPERAIEALLNGDGDQADDFLVIDEIQDIARESYLDVLDLMVAGGLKKGRLLLFGDFERQGIYENDRGREKLRARSPYLMSHKLLQNCRNLPRIGFQVNLLGKLEPGYQKDQFRRQDDGVDPTVIPYKLGQDQSPALVQAVRSLQGEGFDLSEIVVLSPLRRSSTAETTSDPWLRQVLHSADGTPGRKGRLLHSTIQAFKGLEAPAVVVTDMDRAVANYESLLYVGLTRATDRLFALIESGTLRATFGGTS